MANTTGYIIGVTNPAMSGLATVRVASRKGGKGGTSTLLYTEAGFGVRQLVSMFGGHAEFQQRAPITKVRITHDGPLMQSVEFAHA